jgi:F-type H+-transporting ATPase subunit b
MDLFVGEAWAQEGPEAGAPAGEAHEGAAEGGEAEHHEGPDFGLIGMQAINLTLFAIVLFVFARRPIMDALGNRANAVRRDLDESARLKDEADKRYHAIEAQLAGLDRKLEELKAEAAREAEAEAERIRERAEADAVRIRETAERTLREEATRARNEIRKEVVDQATALAREIVKQNVSPEDQARLQGEFLGALRKPAGGEA